MEKKRGLPTNIALPRHVVVIPDGNRRWAKEKNLAAVEGHRRGFERAVELVRAARDWGIHTLTLWGFSTENWKRSRREVGHLMKLFVEMIDRHLEEAHEYKSRIVHLGRRDRLPKKLLRRIERAERETEVYEKYVLNIGLDYNGRDEIIRAINKWQEETGRHGRSRGGITEKRLFEFLDTAGQKYPEPDLIIRTSGELRHSGVLMYQGAYAEYYYEKKCFPDFTVERLRRAILDYNTRRRRFGGN